MNFALRDEIKMATGVEQVRLQVRQQGRPPFRVPTGVLQKAD
jgi:hypothetical protein